MAEVCSSFPTAGGLYYWAAKLAPSHSAAWSWFTGWFNLVGQVAVTAGIDFGAGTFLNALLDLVFGFSATAAHTILLTGVILVVHGLLNTFGVRLVALLNNVSVWWHLIGVLIIVAVLIIVPTHHQSASFVFGHFVNNTGWGFAPYVFLLGLLNAQYTLTGFDASAHMTEETHNAARSGPKGILNSILVSLVAGWVLLIGLTFAIQDYQGTLTTSTGVPPAQIFIDAAGQKTGEFLLLIAVGAQLFCGMASVTANSRMIYAFARDGALPGSRFWHRINKRTRTPTNSVWFAVVGAFILALPALWNTTAYVAVTSIAAVGLYVAYVIPVFLRVLKGDRFERGPWHLGRWSRPIGIVATAWVVFIFVLFMLPTSSPVSVKTFNYTPIAFLVVLGGAAVWWLVSARKWFTGPKVQGTPEELAAVERELEELA
jgi:amino acid permease (GABA permease)